MSGLLAGISQACSQMGAHLKDMEIEVCVSQSHSQRVTRKGKDRDLCDPGARAARVLVSSDRSHILWASLNGGAKIPSVSLTKKKAEIFSVEQILESGTHFLRAGQRVSSTQRGLFQGSSPQRLQESTWTWVASP